MVLKEEPKMVVDREGLVILDPEFEEAMDDPAKLRALIAHYSTDEETDEAMKVYARPVPIKGCSSPLYYMPFILRFNGKIDEATFWAQVSEQESQGHECFVPEYWPRPTV
jgi:hypothetical protein